MTWCLPVREAARGGSASTRRLSLRKNIPGKRFFGSVSCPMNGLDSLKLPEIVFSVSVRQIGKEAGEDGLNKWCLSTAMRMAMA